MRLEAKQLAKDGSFLVLVAMLFMTMLVTMVPAVVPLLRMVTKA